MSPCSCSSLSKGLRFIQLRTPCGTVLRYAGLFVNSQDITKELQGHALAQTLPKKGKKQKSGEISSLMRGIQRQEAVDAEVDSAVPFRGRVLSFGGRTQTLPSDRTSEAKLAAKKALAQASTMPNKTRRRNSDDC